MEQALKTLAVVLAAVALMGKFSNDQTFLVVALICACIATIMSFMILEWFGDDLIGWLIAGFCWGVFAYILPDGTPIFF